MYKSGNSTSLYNDGQLNDIFEDIGKLIGGGGDIINDINDTVKDITGVDVKDIYETGKDVLDTAGDINKTVKDITGVDIIKTGDTLLTGGALTGGNTTTVAPRTGGNTTTVAPTTGGNAASTSQPTASDILSQVTASATNPRQTSAPSVSGSDSRIRMHEEEVRRQAMANERKLAPKTGVAELDGNWLTEQLDKFNKGAYIGAAVGAIGGGLLPGMKGWVIRIAATVGCGAAGHYIYNVMKERRQSAS